MKSIFTLILLLAALFTSVISVKAETPDEKDKIRKRFDPLNRDTMPFATAGRGLIKNGGKWVVDAKSGNLVFSDPSGTTAYTYTFSFTTPTANRTITFGDTDANVQRKSAVLAPGATPSFAPANTIQLYTLTPAENETIAGVTTGCVSGQRMVLLVTTSGTNSYTLTFGANFKTTGTLATGTVTAKVFSIEFVYNGTSFVEVGRTTAM
jgi:hypothetical protein